MKTELALSFIFDPTRAQDLDRIMDLLSYARQRGVTIRGDLDRLDGVRQALATGTSLSGMLEVHPLRCRHCGREFEQAFALTYHDTICPARLPTYMACPSCGRPHRDTTKGRAQHRRYCPNHPSKEVSCAV